jgi:hypothetical protein
MPVLRPNAEHAAKTQFGSRPNAVIPAIMACVHATNSIIDTGLLHFSAPS